MSGWRNTVGNLIEISWLQTNDIHRLHFTYRCVNNRGVRFHRTRDFKRYYFCNIPSTSHGRELDGCLADMLTGSAQQPRLLFRSTALRHQGFIGVRASHLHTEWRTSFRPVMKQRPILARLSTRQSDPTPALYCPGRGRLRGPNGILSHAERVAGVLIAGGLPIKPASPADSTDLQGLGTCICGSRAA